MYKYLVLFSLLLLSACATQNTYDIAIGLCDKQVLIDQINTGVDINTQNYAGWSVIHCATSNGDLSMTEWLVGKGADIKITTEKMGTPLMLAANSNNIELVKFLVDKGADVNAISLKGASPLLISVRANNNEIAKLLVESGADFHYKSPYLDDDALYWAKKNNNNELIEYLENRMKK